MSKPFDIQWGDVASWVAFAVMMLALSSCVKTCIVEEQTTERLEMQLKHHGPEKR